MTTWFTADEHYWHKNIIAYENRPYSDVAEMNAGLIQLHNAVVGPDDTVYHLGDFCFGGVAKQQEIEKQLAGKHVFLRGSHDEWMCKTGPWHEILEITVDGQPIVLCHYALRVWPGSRHGAWHLHGHSHGKLPPLGRSLDVGVDAIRKFLPMRPISFEEIRLVMASRDRNVDEREVRE